MKSLISREAFDCGEKPYLLFDAGGTLIFPNIDWIIKGLQRYGRSIDPDSIYKGYYQVIWKIDQSAIQTGYVDNVAEPWPEGFPYALFDVLGILNNQTVKAARELQKFHIEQKNLWTFTFDWVRTTLKYLHDSKYRMAVLTNSDGRARKIFEDLKLNDYFEQVFESHEMQMEKPNPEIFMCAITRLDVDPSRVIYIGDVYEGDVKGANLAGLAAIHIDPLGFYKDLPGIHLKDVRHLPSWLEDHQDYMNITSGLYPFQYVLKRTDTGFS